MLNKSFGFYALGFIVLLSMSGLGAFFVGVSHQDEAPVARVAEPALATGSPEVAEAPAEEPVIEEEVTEEVVEEEYVKRNATKSQVDDILKDPRLVQSARERMNEEFSSGDLDPNRRPE